MAKIMLIDDEEVIRMLYGEELEDEGYEVILCNPPENRHGIIKTIKQKKPDVVLLDIKLGREYEGFDVLQDIRKNNNTYGIPVIFVSSYDRYKGDLKSIEADYYVVKDSDLTELKGTIKRCLEERV